MEEEHNVHSSKHVFMKRYLKGWCPKSGYINISFYRISMGFSKIYTLDSSRENRTH